MVNMTPDCRCVTQQNYFALQNIEVNKILDHYLIIYFWQKKSSFFIIRLTKSGDSIGTQSHGLCA
jgi:hypothetical protein